MSQAVAEAMEKRWPFSWVRTRKVQAGVYLFWSQEYFQTYVIKDWPG